MVNWLSTKKKLKKIQVLLKMTLKSDYSDHFRKWSEAHFRHMLYKCKCMSFQGTFNKQNYDIRSCTWSANAVAPLEMLMSLKRHDLYILYMNDGRAFCWHGCPTR